MRRAASCLALLTLSVALGACAAGPAPGEGRFGEEARRCLAANAGFTDAWGCVRGLITREDVGAEDPERTRLKALGEALNLDVAGETLTSRDARARLAAALQGHAGD